MFEYTFDPETGGLLLTSNVPIYSNEPRPVYSYELNLFGFNNYWEYEEQNQVPYMWAEANRYMYYGVCIAKISGGTMYTPPKIEPCLDSNGNPLLPYNSKLNPVNIELMNDKNAPLLNSLKQFTVKKIFNVFKKYQNKVDCFHVAFSGGKDSIVLLDLVQSALPKSSFIVLFGDTGMEFPDTYKVVDEVEQQCKEKDIVFYRASSHLKPEESWMIFGPPASNIRWCCSVHKTAPQTLAMREILNKTDFTGLDYVGVRAQESVQRSTYTYENYGKKQKGQYSHNPLLEWGSAETWLYIFANKLVINNAYKKGNLRAGCLVCPNSSPRSNFVRLSAYPKEVNKFLDLIRSKCDDPKMDTYISNSAWSARKNGRDLKDNPPRYEEEIIGTQLVIHVKNPSSNWREWIKTIEPVPFEFSVIDTKDGFDASMPVTLDKTPQSKLFKKIFHKSAYCIGCRVCEANCPHGCISFEGKLHIEGCKQCGLCNGIDDGCILFKSIHLPVNGGPHMKKSINTYADHAPKPEWIQDFIYKQDDFLNSHNLGPMMISHFKRFLKDAELYDKKYNLTDFNSLINAIGWDSVVSWALIYTNLVYNNVQMRWYVENLPLNIIQPREVVEDLLKSMDISQKDASSIVKAFKRLCETPLGTILHIGSAYSEGNTFTGVERTTTDCKDGDVVLYCLYRYAELEKTYQLSIKEMIDSNSAGIDPIHLFGISKEDMETILNGLSIEYPELINVSFTNGLDKIMLFETHTSKGVLTAMRAKYE